MRAHRREQFAFVLAVSVAAASAVLILNRSTDAAQAHTARVLAEKASRSHRTSAPTPHAFAPDSFWYTPLGSKTPVNPLSSVYVQDIQRQISTYKGFAWIATKTYSTPVYTVPDDQPRVPLRLWDCQHKGARLQTGRLNQAAATQLAKIPIPPDAEPANGTDAAMAVWQPGTDTYWETWKTRRVNGQWQACWGGRLDHASTTEGDFPAPFGSTATGIALLGGLIRINELQQGHIDHAIDIALPETRSSVFSWPATRTDGRNSSPVAIPEGLRFRLDPTLDLSQFHLSPAARIIAVAAQKYGMVVRDKAGSVSLYAEDPTPLVRSGQADPYKTIFQGQYNLQVLDNFPWNHLIALPMNYGKP